MYTPDQGIAVGMAVLERNVRDTDSSFGLGLYADGQAVFQSLFARWDIDLALGAAAAERNRDLGDLCLRQIFAAQWRNGMIPNYFIPKREGLRRWKDPTHYYNLNLGTGNHPEAPDEFVTSPHSQPALLAKNLYRYAHSVGRERGLALEKTYWRPTLAFHGWMHAERGYTDETDGSYWLASPLPYEFGTDDLADWVELVRGVHKQLPMRGRLAAAAVEHSAILERTMHRIRSDASRLDPATRMKNSDVMLYNLGLKTLLRGCDYDGRTMQAVSPFLASDVASTAFALESHVYLKKMADDIGETVPDELERANGRLAASFPGMWEEWFDVDGRLQQRYCNQAFMLQPDGSRRRVPLRQHHTISSPMALAYSDIDPAHAGVIVHRLASDFGLDRLIMGVPSLSAQDPLFRGRQYWFDGPVWLHENAELSEALGRFEDPVANDLQRYITASSLPKSRNERQQPSVHEYYDPLTGDPLGAYDFTMGAAAMVLQGHRAIALELKA